MANLEIPMKVEIELNEDDRKLLQRFGDSVKSMQPPTIETEQLRIPEVELFCSMFGGKR